MGWGGKDTDLSDDFSGRVQLEEPPRETGSMCMVVCLSKDTNRTPQCDLKVEGLELAVRKVRRKFQAACDVLRLFLRDTSSLELDRDTK